MRRFVLFAIFTFQFGHIRAQNTTMFESTRDRINLNGLQVPAYGVFFGVAGEGGKVVGDAYLDSTFQAGNIRFYGRMRGTDTLMGVPIRLDLLSNQLEVKAGPTDIRVAKGPTVKQFVVNNSLGSVSRFVNAREYRGDADAVNGFFERVVPDQVSTTLSRSDQLELLIRPYLFLRKGNYNAALNVGSKDDQLVKKTDWYAARNGKATRFSPGKKAILELMADKQQAIETYLKTEKPDLKSRSGLMAVFTHYNSLSM